MSSYHKGGLFAPSARTAGDPAGISGPIRGLLKDSIRGGRPLQVSASPPFANGPCLRSSFAAPGGWASIRIFSLSKQDRSESLRHRLKRGCHSGAFPQNRRSCPVFGTGHFLRSLAFRQRRDGPAPA